MKKFRDFNQSEARRRKLQDPRDEPFPSRESQQARLDTLLGPDRKEIPAPALQRSPSTGSMKERTFRTPSPPPKRIAAIRKSSGNPFAQSTTSRNPAASELVDLWTKRRALLRDIASKLDSLSALEKDPSPLTRQLEAENDDLRDENAKLRATLNEREKENRQIANVADRLTRECAFLRAEAEQRRKEDEAGLSLLQSTRSSTMTIESSTHPRSESTNSTHQATQMGHDPPAVIDL